MHAIVTDENDDKSSPGTCIINCWLDDSSFGLSLSSSFPTVVTPNPSVSFASSSNKDC